MLLDYLETLNTLDTIESVWAHHAAYMARFGFDRLLYGYTRNRTERSFGDRQDILILTNHDPAYVHEFIDRGLYFHSPMVRWASQTVGPGSWSLIPKYAEVDNPQFRQLVAVNKKFGVTAGYSISFRETTTRSKAAIGLAAQKGMSQDEVECLWGEHGRTILQMNNIAHMKLITLPHEPKDRRLTKRQREVLEWVGDGKTVQDISQIMALTPATIEKHLRLARETLNVETTAQAVLKASFNNQIFVIER
jgi:LuxR family transcriptional regulator